MNILNIRKILSFSIGPIGSSILGLISLPIMTWFYSQEDIGKGSFIFVAIGFVTLIFSMGLDQYYIRIYHETANKHKLFFEMFIPGFIILVLFLFLLLLYDPLYISNELFSVKSVKISIYISLLFFLSYIIRYLSLILRMKEDGLKYSFSQLINKIMFMLFLFLFYIYNVKFDFESLVELYTISYLFNFIYLLYITKDDVYSILKQKIDPDVVKLALSFGFPLIFGGLAYWGLTTVDRIFLKHYSSFNELALYSVSSSFAGIAIIVQSVFSTIWAPSIYKISAEDRDLSVINDIRDIITLVIIVIFCFSGLFSGVVTLFLPNEYNDVKFILVACMGLPLLYTLSETTVIGINLTKKTSYSMLSSTLAFFVNLVGNYILIPYFGAAGAAISTCFSFFIFLVLRTEFSCYLWIPFKRTKMYVLISIVCTNAMAMAIFKTNYEYIFIIIWLSLLVLTPFIFQKEVKNAYKIFKFSFAKKHDS